MVHCSACQIYDQPISLQPFQDSRLIGWLDFFPWSCRWGSVVRWSVWEVRRQASLTVDRYSGHHARKSGLGHLSAVPNRIKILEISPHSQTAFALEMPGLHGRWETIEMNSENNKEVFSHFFLPLLEKKKSKYINTCCTVKRPWWV